MARCSLWLPLSFQLNPCFGSLPVTQAADRRGRTGVESKPQAVEKYTTRDKIVRGLVKEGTC